MTPADLNLSVTLLRAKPACRGPITKGKLADVVLLDADPLLNIDNTQRIHAVIVKGRFLDRNALDSLLAEAANDVKNK
jgi:imidazolonepropionase-like amidohydrolase